MTNKEIRWETQKEIDEEGFEKPEVDEDFIYDLSIDSKFEDQKIQQETEQDSKR